jgi:hypothetical protein
MRKMSLKTVTPYLMLRLQRRKAFCGIFGDIELQDFFEAIISFTSEVVFFYLNGATKNSAKVTEYIFIDSSMCYTDFSVELGPLGLL